MVYLNGPLTVVKFVRKIVNNTASDALCDSSILEDSVDLLREIKDQALVRSFDPISPTAVCTSLRRHHCTISVVLAGDGIARSVAGATRGGGGRWGHGFGGREGDRSSGAPDEFGLSVYFAGTHSLRSGQMTAELEAGVTPLLLRHFALPAQAGMVYRIDATPCVRI